MSGCSTLLLMKVLAQLRFCSFLQLHTEVFAVFVIACARVIKSVCNEVRPSANRDEHI